MATRKEEALKTRKKLIVSANKIISKKGINNTSVEDITKDACVAKGTFYTYFKNKEEIVNELIYDSKEKYADEFLKESIKFKIKEYNKNLQERITSKGIEVCRSWISSNIVEQENSILKSDIEKISQILESSIENNELTNNINVLSLANFIVNVNYGEMLNWYMTNGKYNPLTKIDETTEIIINSLSKYIKEEN